MLNCVAQLTLNVSSTQKYLRRYVISHKGQDGAIYLLVQPLLKIEYEIKILTFNQVLGFSTLSERDKTLGMCICMYTVVKTDLVNGRTLCYFS